MAVCQTVDRISPWIDRPPRKLIRRRRVRSLTSDPQSPIHTADLPFPIRTSQGTGIDGQRRPLYNTQRLIGGGTHWLWAVAIDC